MDQKKLKVAFLKVRNDYNALEDKLNQLKNKVEESETRIPIENDIEKTIKKLDKVDFEKFTTNLENEFKSINILINEFNDRFVQNGEIIKKFSIELEKYNTEIEDIKQQLKRTSNSTANVDLDINLIGEKFEEYQELLQEKVDLEINGMRLEFIEEIAKLYDRIDTKLNIAESKNNNDNNNNNTVIHPPKLEEKPKKLKKKKSEPGRIKKAVTWLVNGDDEDDFSDIKSEVKKGN
jgi:hypothetical protein